MLRLGLRPQPRSSPPRWIAPKQVLELAQARKTYNSNSGIARDDADLAAAIGEGPALRRFREVRRADGAQLETRLQPLQYLAARHDELLLPGAAGIERHELDEAEAQILLAGKPGERLDFVVVQSANHDGVDLNRMQSQFLRQ